MQRICITLCCIDENTSGFNEEIDVPHRGACKDISVFTEKVPVIHGLEKGKFGPCRKNSKEEFFHEGLFEAGSSARNSRRTYLPDDISEASKASSVSGTWSEESSVQLQERPRQTVEEGACYTGQWRRNFRHGHGKIENHRVGTYEGQFVDNRVSGEGRFVKLNGDVYEGQFCQDQAHGEGTYLHKDGRSYEGQWEEDLKSGQGVDLAGWFLLPRRVLGG